MRAFADESVGRFSTQAIYVMCAALIEDRGLEEIRHVMRGLRKGSTKLHWYEESSQRRHQLLKVVSGLDLEFVISHHIAHPSQQALMRRVCIRQLAHELFRRGVDHLTLEARNRVDDRRDIFDINWIRQAEGSSMWLQHVRGTDEPALWIADLICGATSAQFRGDETFNKALNQIEIRHV